MQTQKVLTISLLLILIICNLNNSYAISPPLIKGKVVEKETGMPIAFASIIYQTKSYQKGVISDVDGSFIIRESNINSITVSCVGYKRNKITISSNMDLSNIIVELEKRIQELDEVVITPGVNPAIRIIKQVLNNKEINNHENIDKYSFNNYVKTIIDIKHSKDISDKDSLRLKRLTEEYAGFISEHVVSVKKAVIREENKIVAHKTSGLENPLLVQSFAIVFHDIISFYNNSVSLFRTPISNDKSLTEYISPISDNCLRIYDFQLENTNISNSDTVFVINFKPRKGKNFNSLQGTLFISSNQYAIKNIVVEPYEEGLINFKFRQDYEFIDGIWFPTNLYEEIGFVGWKNHLHGIGYPTYFIKSRIDDVDFSPEFTSQEISLETITIDKSAINKSDSILDIYRPEPLTLREINTYHHVDSVWKSYNIEYWFNLIPKLAEGKIPIGYLDIGLDYLYIYNKYEGSRLGIGLNTNEKISKYFSLGGFVGYGFEDDALKYGGQVNFIFDSYNEIELKLSYQNNLKEVGSEPSLFNSSQTFSEYLRKYIAYRFDDCIEQKAEFSFRAFRYLKIATSLNLRKIKPNYAYLYQGLSLDNYYADNIQVSAGIGFGEQLITYAGQRVVNYEGNPVINFTYKRGVDWFNAQSYKYNHFETQIDFTYYNGRIGQSDFRLAGGFIDKSVPYGLLFTGEGSKDSNLPLLINDSFQAMLPYEFLSDKYINLFYTHNFGSLIFKVEKFKPKLLIAQNVGWGVLKNDSYHQIDFKTMDNIYFESGLIINDILRLKYINLFYFGFGVGGFYRYGYYGYDNFEDNFALKFSLSVSIN